MGRTSIEWTDFSINPIRARLNSRTGHYCEKVSPGCKFCYSSRLQKRFGMPEFQDQRNEDVEVFFDESKLLEVVRRKKPTKYFWCDMTDMFGAWVRDEWIDRCFVTMTLTPQHTHQVLTKRPERMAEYLGEIYAGRMYDLPGDDRPEAEFTRIMAAFANELPNVWLGTSVEDQPAADERIHHLLQIPATVRFVSYEPALGPVDFTNIKCVGAGSMDSLTGRLHETDSAVEGLSWIIAGGESGPGARPMHPDWARSARDQCQAAGVAFFFKQWGEWGLSFSRPPGSKGRFAIINDRSHVKVDSYPRQFDVFGSVVMDRLGKKAAGRQLDGREWNEFPVP